MDLHTDISDTPWVCLSPRGRGGESGLGRHLPVLAGSSPPPDHISYLATPPGPMGLDQVHRTNLWGESESFPKPPLPVYGEQASHSSLARPVLSSLILQANGISSPGLLSFMPRFQQPEQPPLQTVICPCPHLHFLFFSEMKGGSGDFRRTAEIEAKTEWLGWARVSKALT